VKTSMHGFAVTWIWEDQFKNSNHIKMNARNVFTRGYGHCDFHNFCREVETAAEEKFQVLP
jgi:hypothetical protein